MLAIYRTFSGQEPAPKKRPILTVESLSGDEEESPPVPLKWRKLKKAAPAPEPRLVIRTKVTGNKPRPPHVIIEEPTEEELNILLSKPVESDNSSPGAEVPLQETEGTSAPTRHPVEGSDTFVNSTGEPTFNPSSFVSSANEVNQTSEPQDSADHSRQHEEELVDDEFLAATEDVPEEHHQE
ncbi:unnamed protein product [Vicia faba]|uniref:Uncharacterized protein n=1 Tax=Vicia faba TaxID=3906 RepID=A0AAV1A4Z8_VICFA|nr:unnamed protein product [Vicia faba]